MEQPLISISIITYNRDRYLRQMLQSLAGQCRRAAGRVEIIVNDNHSTDQTADVVRSMTEEIGSIRYYQNERNFGVVANYGLALKRSRGAFVCIPGDDDLYEDFFVELARAFARGGIPAARGRRQDAARRVRLDRARSRSHGEPHHGTALIEAGATRLSIENLGWQGAGRYPR
jgi:glycosyltransferase involved in cell wall biosynthesis